jgi:hypothetical protein
MMMRTTSAKLLAVVVYLLKSCSGIIQPHRCRSRHGDPGRHTGAAAHNRSDEPLQVCNK